MFPATHEPLLDSARAGTGLDDFGDPSFLEGLAVLVRSLHGDAHLNAPWLRKRTPRGDDVLVVLDTARGPIRIEGETVISTFAMGRPELPPDFPVLQQAGARYRWDGETTCGMMERSTPANQITR